MSRTPLAARYGLLPYIVYKIWLVVVFELSFVTTLSQCQSHDTQAKELSVVEPLEELLLYPIHL